MRHNLFDAKNGMLTIKKIEKIHERMENISQTFSPFLHYVMHAERVSLEELRIKEEERYALFIIPYNLPTICGTLHTFRFAEEY